MLNVSLSRQHEFFRDHGLEFVEESETRVLLAPINFFTRPLVQLTLDLAGGKVRKSRLKLKRSLLTHRRFSGEVRSFLEAYIEASFPQKIAADFCSWFLDQSYSNPGESEQHELSGFSLRLGVSKNVLQLEATGKVDTWWNRLTKS